MAQHVMGYDLEILPRERSSENLPEIELQSFCSEDVNAGSRPATVMAPENDPTTDHFVAPWKEDPKKPAIARAKAAAENKALVLEVWDMFKNVYSNGGKGVKVDKPPMVARVADKTDKQ